MCSCSFLRDEVTRKFISGGKSSIKFIHLCLRQEILLNFSRSRKKFFMTLPKKGKIFFLLVFTVSIAKNFQVSVNCQFDICMNRSVEYLFRDMGSQK